MGRLFIVTMAMFLSGFFPARRQQLMAFLEELAEQLPEDPGNPELLQLWLEEYGIGGAVLANVALFAVGLLLVVVLDVPARQSYAGFSALAALYTLSKFRCRRPKQDLLSALLVLYWLCSGFSWCICYILLIIFTNFQAFAGRGEPTC